MKIVKARKVINSGKDLCAAAFGIVNPHHCSFAVKDPREVCITPFVRNKELIFGKS